MKTRILKIGALSMGLLSASLALAGDRMVLVYGGENADFANLRRFALATLAGEPVPSGVRVVQVEGTRTLSAEHSPQAGTRAFFLADGGGFSFDGFSPNGASVQLRVLGSEPEEALAKEMPAVEPLLRAYGNALGKTSLEAGVLRMDYTQAKAGRVQVEALGVNGKVLGRAAWEGEPGRHGRSLLVLAAKNQVVFLRWKAGDQRMTRKIIAR
jgi:hypothetical protein